MIKRLIRRLLLAAFLLGVVGLIVYAFLPQPVAVDVTAVRRGPLRVTVEEHGKTRIRDRYVVAAPLAGRLQRVELKAGHAVAAGRTLVAVIEPTDPALLDPRARAEAEARRKAAEAAKSRALSQLDRARVAQEHARNEHARIQRLSQSHSASQAESQEAVTRERTANEDLRTAQFAAQIAEFELELARAALARTQPPSPGEAEAWRVEILAPIDGRVLRVFQESSTVITPGQRLLELGDPNNLEIEIDVLSADAVKIKPGAKVLLEHWGGAEPLQAQVRLVEPAAFTKVSALGVEEQRVWVVADFADPPARRQALGDAYRVEARIVIWEGDNVLKVPAGALVRHGDGWAVYRLLEGRARLQPVEVGPGNGLETEVLGGLSEGDPVLLHPSDKIHDGGAVAPRAGPISNNFTSVSGVHTISRSLRASE
jgi:HlyD family secretion protein